MNFNDKDKLFYYLFIQKKKSKIINKINITGNSITKDKTIRSKIIY